MFVRVARDAAARIRERGGRLYLWEQPVGADFVRDRYAFERPPDRWQFDCAVATGVEVCVDPDVGAHEVRVEPGRWPRRGLRVYVDGKRWGLRGYEPGLG